MDDTMAVTYRNGFFFLEGFPYDMVPNWVTIDYSDDKPYFHLNSKSREKFRDDILPLIKNKECTISPETYLTIKNYPKTRFAQFGIEKVKYKSPKGITLEDHQDKAVRIMLKNNKFGLFLGTGTGKTLIAITWMLNKQIKGDILIVTPKKVIEQYRKECKTYLDTKTYEKITIINFESLHKVKHKNYTAVLIDESHRAKNYTSNTNRYLKQITRKAYYVYLFTGTPQDDSRHEIIPQLYLLEDRYMPTKTRFIHRYFTLDDYYNPRSEKRHLKDELDSMIHEITWGKQSHEVLDLTKANNYRVMCDHPGKYYEELAKEYIVNIKGIDIVADSKASLKIKLREICNGHIMYEDEDLKKQTISLPNPKILLFLALIRTLNTGIIYTEFDADIDRVTQALDSLNRSYVVVNGKTKKSGPLIDKFKNSEVEFLVIQSRSGNAGLDLTVTNNVIFYSMPESYIVYHQCKSRIRRYGQDKECNYYHMICRDTVEEQIYKSLKKKKSFSTRLFKIYN